MPAIRNIITAVVALGAICAATTTYATPNGVYKCNSSPSYNVFSFWDDGRFLEVLVPGGKRLADGIWSSGTWMYPGGDPKSSVLLVHETTIDGAEINNFESYRIRGNDASFELKGISLTKASGGNVADQALNVKYHCKRTKNLDEEIERLISGPKKLAVFRR